VKRACGEIGQTIDLLEHAADHVAIALRLTLALQRHLADAAHRGQWRAQLVRSGGGEAAQLVESLLDARQRFIERGGKAPEFIAWIRHRQALAKRLCADAT